MTDLAPETPDAFCDPAGGRIYLNGRRFADLPYVMDPDSSAVPLFLVSADALAAEKAAREEAESGQRIASDEVHRLNSAMYSLREEAEDRAVKAEQERNTLEARLFASQAAYDDLARETGVALDKAWTAKNDAERELADLRARIEAVRRALGDELQNLADDGARLSQSVVRRIEAALSPTDPTKEGE